MAPNYYDIGDVVRTSSTFTDTGGTKADPGGLTWVFTEPDGTDTVHTRSGTGSTSTGSIFRTTDGVYYRDWTVTASGTHWYRYSSTGNITAAAEANFRVRNRHTDT